MSGYLAGVITRTFDADDPADYLPTAETGGVSDE